jgi:TM2 domain-containing membrane protein YozV
VKRRHLGIAYVLLLVFGWAGAHRFYLRHYGWGYIYLITLGCFGLGILLDLFLLPGLVDGANRGDLEDEGRIPQARTVETS